MPLEIVLAWWNLIYIVPFLLALFYLGLFVFTGITFGEADADVDTGADIGAHADTTLHVEAHVVDHDVSHVGGDADLSGEHDMHGTPDGAAAIMPHVPAAHHAESQGEPSVLSSFLTMLGVGKIPLSLALMVLMMIWGVVGFASNALLRGWLGDTAALAALSVPATLVISLAMTGAVAALIAKIIPPDSETHERKSDLVGKAGEAIYDIDATFGMASVRGAHGDFFQVPCRTAVGKARIAKGTRVVLFDYDREKGVYQVAPFDA